MSRLKKILSLFVAIVMISTLIPTLTLADTAEVVYLTVANTTFPATSGASWEGKILDNVEVEITDGMKVMDVITETLEENGIFQQGADMGYITEVNGVGEFGAGSGGGWMILLNDWFISAGADELYVSDGDSISLLYTAAGFGEDLGGTWANNDKSIKEITFSDGTLSEEFSSEVYDYILTVPSETESIKITPIATNKNFQTRIYLNTEVLYGENGAYIDCEEEYEAMLSGFEPWSTLPENLIFYKKAQNIPIEDGDIVTVVCGLSYWNSMNNGIFGNGAENEDGCIYKFIIEKEAPIVETEDITVDIGVYDYTAVSHKEENPDIQVSVSQSGVIYEEECIVEEGKSVLDALKETFESAQIEYSLDANGTYFTMVNGLCELDCTSQSGWMISVNDEFLTVAASEKVLNHNDKVKLHYSVRGWGTDVGNYFTGGPVLNKITLGNTETVISSNTVYEDENDWTGTTTYYLGEYVENGENTEIDGNGTIEAPYIIPIEVPADTNVTSLISSVETTLHKEYLNISEGENLKNILTQTNYENDVTFGIETLGGFYKTYYTVKVKKEIADEEEDSYLPRPSARPTNKEEKVKKEEVLADTASYIYEMVTDPIVGSIGGEWAIIGLARSSEEVPDEYFQKYYVNVENYVKEHKGILHEKKYTEYSRVILALTSIGKNPADVGGYNLLTPLGDYEKTIFQGVNGAIWALIALDSMPYDMPQNSNAKTQATRDMYIDYILDSQKDDGGWALVKGTPQSDIDITAMALCSLSAYTQRADVSSAVEKAIAMLSARQNSSGGFNGGETAESSAQVICALCSLGIKIDDAHFVKAGKTVLDSLLSYRKGDGFKHIKDGGVNQMATEQAFYSLVALYRMENNLPPIMKMTDVKIALEDAVKEEAAPDIIEINFSDIIGHKNEYAIKKLAQKGIINGKGEGIFDPGNTMTRAEFATIIVRALGVETKNTDAFTDVKETDWFYGYVGAAYESGIINGVGEGLFNPHGTVTRQEASAMLSRAAALLGMDNNIEAMAARDTLSMYIDYVKTADWAIKPLAFCISKGIINEEGLEILPEKEVTRAEIAQMLYNLMERVGRI